ncbi:hypothetical protein NQ314_003678 [Rhamnusium bicolor]|uniref:Reverse transcriptase zinc-binding domain-containing protein n=1 Tax=Rhamnusium bicolor TaxID=1586634 RepID=A0AAV8ZM64_9CUCU|nr:hypothetical protein NQ314_003678 [Rhamnusium bicolor]
MLLRVGSAYRTTSTVALQVITGVIPIDLMVEERRYLYEMGNGQELAIRKAARERILNLWQRRWELNEEKGQWTKRFIPDLRPWVTCRHRRTDFYISQFLTGHGSFGTYTQRLGISENALCVYCGEEDSPEHTVLYCHRWAPYRIAIYGELGQLTAETLVAHMIEDKWQGNTIAYPLKERIPPIYEDLLTPAQNAFDRAHKRTRRIIENAFGILREMSSYLNHLQVNPFVAGKLSLDDDEAPVDDTRDPEDTVPHAAAGAQTRLQQLINYFRI